MGDISTHRKLYEDFVKPRLGLPDEQAIFVELGNYLTDVSQFRDPFAHLSGKKAVWNAGRAKLWGLRFFFLADLVADLDGYLDVLMGMPDRNDPQGRARVPHGQLAAWFREMIFAYSLEKTFRRQASPFDYLIDPPELRRLYDSHFTQYYPHEHLDFPPGRGTGRLDDFSASALAAAGGGGARRIAAYLERHLEYVSDLLTRIERDWAHGAAGPAAARAHDNLVRLGHAGHAVDDFFFHSNFTELAFALTGAPLPQFDPSDTVDDHDPEGDAVPPPTSSRWPRLYHRRGRRPVLGDDGETFSTSTSTAADLVFTGSFGSEDIFHTIMDALGFLAVEPSFDAAALARDLAAACGAANRQAALLAALATVPAAQAGDVPFALLHVTLFGGEEDKKKAYEAYKCLVESGAMDAFAARLATMGVIHRLSAEAVGRACTIERGMLSGFSLVGKGVLGLLLDLLGEAKDRSAASKARSAELDGINDGELGGPAGGRTGYNESDNGASAERVGTHSLLAKDSVRKQPLRKEAINLAGFTVSYMAGRMAAEKAAGGGDGSGLDWAELLRHFVGHPEQAAGGPAAPWWKPVLDWDRAEGTRPPELHTVQRVAAGDVTTRAGEVARVDLEQWYNDLVAVAEARYRSAVTKDFVLDSLINGGLVGGVAGGLAAGFSDDKSVGGVFAAIGVGLFTGALLTGATAGIGAAIDDRAGAVVGMLVGVTGSAVASVFLGKELAGI